MRRTVHGNTETWRGGTSPSRLLANDAARACLARHAAARVGWRGEPNARMAPVLVQAELRVQPGGDDNPLHIGKTISCMMPHTSRGGNRQGGGRRPR
jgi:hypothetical protein